MLILWQTVSFSSELGATNKVVTEGYQKVAWSCKNWEGNGALSLIWQNENTPDDHFIIPTAPFQNFH